jgi:hypothetical protein
MMFRKLFRRLRKLKQEKHKPDSWFEKVQRERALRTPIESIHVDFALRSAFDGEEPLSLDQYLSKYRHGSAGAYFNVPKYEEYLQLFNVYKYRVKREELKGDQEPEPLPAKQPLDQDAFQQLNIGYELRELFMFQYPLSRWWYDEWRISHRYKLTSLPNYEEYKHLFGKYKGYI